MLKINWKKYTRKTLIFVTVILTLVIFDLVIKQIAHNELKYQERISLLGNTIHLVYAENSGGMLSIGSDLPEYIRIYIFQGFVGIVLIGLLLFVIVKNNLLLVQKIALLLFISGGIGNLSSRIFNDGKVIDFLVIEMFDLKTGIFNIADVYITIGMILIFVSNFIIRRSHKKSEKSSV